MKIHKSRQQTRSRQPSVATLLSFPLSDEISVIILAILIKEKKRKKIGCEKNFGDDDPDLISSIGRAPFSCEEFDLSSEKRRGRAREREKEKFLFLEIIFKSIKSGVFSRNFDF